MGTAAGLVSSTLILKIQQDPECLTGQPRSMLRLSETMAWRDLYRKGGWEISPGEGTSALGKESCFGRSLRHPQVAFIIDRSYQLIRDHEV